MKALQKQVDDLTITHTSTLSRHKEFKANHQNCRWDIENLEKEAKAWKHEITALRYQIANAKPTWEDLGAE